jgi:hypothetical protein
VSQCVHVCQFEIRELAKVPERERETERERERERETRSNILCKVSRKPPQMRGRERHTLLHASSLARVSNRTQTFSFSC